MHSTLERYKKFVIEKQAIKNTLETQLISVEDTITELTDKITTHTAARWVIAEVSRKTQEQFVAKVESIVTLALRSAYPDRDFRFICKFEIKRNKSECFLMVAEGDSEPFEPKFETGGGLIDVLSMALKIIFCSLQNPKTRPLLIFDEPFKNADTYGMREQLGAFLKKISHQLNCQMLIITHEPEYMEIADKSWMAQFDGTKVKFVEKLIPRESEKEIGPNE